MTFNQQSGIIVIMTMMIFVKDSSPKRKKRKLSAKQRELQQSWEQLLKKYPTKNFATPKSQDLSSVYSLGIPAGRETPKIPSLNSGKYDCFKKDVSVYTGDKIKGIGTMHKSNAVPIFSNEEAEDIAKMRR